MKHLDNNNCGEAIILAGGLGTRLREAVPELPKCMAPVAGRPFIAHVIDALRMQGIAHFIFSLGYRAELIEAYLKESYPTLSYTTVVEAEPLGTGGGILLAMQAAKRNDVVIANGDTLFKVNLQNLCAFHFAHAAECTLALKPMKDFDRYGAVAIDERNRIASFQEKKYYSEGLINGGVYLVNRQHFLSRQLPGKFSFEKDYLEAFTGEGVFYGDLHEGYFIDIGIPGDFRKAGEDLQRLPLDLAKIDKDWTLFLDRDGVINDERLGLYVLHWGEFVFSKGVLEIFKKLSETFGRIIIVTNQRGVEKGLMSEADLLNIHSEMQREVELAGGHIDHIYYCTDRDDRCARRKPNPGMAADAIRDFPDIDPAKSIMVGNKPSDMRFGRAAGFHTVFVRTTNPEQAFPHADIDLVFPSLWDFAQAL